MYAKLVLRNAKRSVKDYLVYIVTMTICVMLLLFVPVHFQQLLSAGYWKRIQFYGIRRRYESGYLCDYPLSAFPDTVCQ